MKMLIFVEKQPTFSSKCKQSIANANTMARTDKNNS